MDIKGKHNTVKLKSNKLLEVSKEIFPETRNLTKDELQDYNAVWDKMSQDLGFNFLDND